MDLFLKISPTSGAFVPDMKAASTRVPKTMDIPQILVIVMMELAFDAPTIMKPPRAGPPPPTGIPTDRLRMNLHVKHIFFIFFPI
jgi:hypothetical protein